MRKSHLVFIILSLVLAVLATVLVVRSHHQQMSALQDHLNDKVSQVNSSFDLALFGVREQMSQIANYLANSPAIQQTFLEGRKAVEFEGGGAGGALAEQAREKLLVLSQARWQELDLGFEFLHVHYHLPGKVTSFLRVHNPGQFGDLLVPFRHILPEAHEKKRLVSGLELGRGGLFIRGVAPVFAYDEEFKQEVYVGTLEFATSMRRAIEQIAKNQGVDLAVLLNIDSLGDVVHPEQLEELNNSKTVVGDFLVYESSTDPGTMLRKHDLKSVLGPSGMDLHGHDDRYHWLAAFSLRDFWGEQNPQRPDIGLVYISSDATQSIHAIEENFRQNIIIAIIGFLLAGILLWLVLQITVQKLEEMVISGRLEVEEKNSQLQIEMSAKDELYQQREELIVDLRMAIEDVKALSGLLPICSYCKKIRNDEGYWQRLEAYIEKHSEAQFSHGICHECLEEQFPEMHDRIKNKDMDFDRSEKD